MKKTLLMAALLALTSVSYGRSPVIKGGLPDVWNAIQGPYGTVWVGMAGKQSSVAVPGQLVYQHPFGYIAQAPRMNQFLVRVGPNSHERRCRPQDSSKAKNFTGVVSQEIGLETTRLRTVERSPSKPGWINYIFDVNGGTPVTVQTINVVFRPAGNVQCHFELLYRNTEREVLPPMPPSPPGPIGPIPRPRPLGEPEGAQPAVRALAAPQAATEKATQPKAESGMFRIGQPLKLEKK